MPRVIESDIPQQMDALTPDWLTGVLRERGDLGTGRVAGIEARLLGEGEAFMGEVARLHLRYEGDDSAAPRTLIAKLPSPIEENRLMGELMGAYWREIHFYRELSHRAFIRTPRHCHSDLTPDPMRPSLDKILRVLDRMPGWLVDPMMAHAKKVTGKSEHRYLLLMEDLAPARAHDQMEGGSLETCESVLSAVAAMHAGYWQSPILDSSFWLSKLSATAKIRHRMYREARAAFLEQQAERLGDFGLELINWHDQHGVHLQRRLHLKAPSTLLHGDLRLDNIFFEDSATIGEIILADWQMVARGPAAYDVAYFLSGAMDVNTPAKAEEELLRHYHDELQKGGVTDYPFERFQCDYWRGLMAMLQVHGTADTVQVGEGRGVELMDLWLDRTLARLRNVSFDQLP